MTNTPRTTTTTTTTASPSTVPTTSHNDHSASSSFVANPFTTATGTSTIVASDIQAVMFPRGLAYYQNCALGGILSSGVIHTMITPLDVVKCNLQVDPAKYKNIRTGLQLILQEQGFINGLFKGWAPTLTAYSCQGALKFGLYELFKDILTTATTSDDGDNNNDTTPDPTSLSQLNKSAIYIASAASAEAIADIAMCPWEMVKVKMQTSPKGTFPTKFGPALFEMMQHESYRFPFGSLGPLWGRQIPFAICKFFCFEQVVEGIYTHVLTSKPKQEYTATTQLSVTLVSGMIAGIICGIVSHPADSLVSLMGRAEYSDKTPYQIVRKVGIYNLCTKGLFSRLIMVGSLTGMQWWAYDTFKTSMGMGTTGGASSK